MKMLHRISLLAGVASTVFLLLPFTYAQGGPGRGQLRAIYNPATESTLKGTVEEVQTATGRRGWHGTHLVLKTADQSVQVHLGPKSFLKEEGFSLSKGDQIEVTGSMVKLKSGEALIAREVKKGDETLVLRNKQGVPQWSRSRWR